jgi:hypothetical protein
MKIKKRIGRFAKKYLPYTLVERIHFPLERKLYLNQTADVCEQRPSVVFFTLQKCASTFTPKLMKYLSGKYLGLSCVDLEGYLYNKTDHIFNDELERRPWLLRQVGYVYCPLRYAIDLHHLDGMKVLLMVRDPRDIMVSQYFSSAYSHEVPVDARRRQRFLRSRAEIQEMSVDEYVLSRVDRMNDRFEEYIKMVEQSNGSILAYEEMVTDFDAFISRLGAILSVEVEDQDRQVLNEMGGFSEAVSGDIYQHRRNIMPGEHRQKLSDATISEINGKLSGALAFFKYDL